MRDRTRIWKMAVLLLGLWLTLAGLTGCGNKKEAKNDFSAALNENEESYTFKKTDTYKNYMELENQWKLPDGMGDGDYGIGDPFVMRYDGKYYLYPSSSDHAGAEQAIKVYESEDLVNWTYLGYAAEGEAVAGAFAPEVFYYNGTFYMVTAPYGKGHYLLSADNPKGPFQVVSENFGLKFDGSYYVGNDGEVYFLYPENDTIRIAAVDPVTMLPTNQASSMNASMNGWTEGPGLFRRNGILYLTYTGTKVTAPCYRVGYSYCLEDDPLGFFTLPVNNTLLINVDYGSGDGVNDLKTGLGHSSNCVGPNLDSWYTAYHTLISRVGPKRCLMVDQLVTNGGILLANGPTFTEVPVPERPDFETRGVADGFISENSTEEIYTIEFNVTPAKGSTVEYRFAYMDSDNYATVRWDMLSGNLALVQLSKGKESQLGTASVNSLLADVFHTIRIEKGADKVLVYVDGMQKLEAAAKGIGAGKIGVSGNAAYSYIAFSNDVFGTGDFEVIKNLPGAFAATHYLKGKNRGYAIQNAKVKENGIRQNEPENTRYKEEDGSYALLLDTPNDWVKYAVNVTKESSHYGLSGKVSANSEGAVIQVIVDESKIYTFTVPSAGEVSEDDANLMLGEFPLEVGNHTLKIRLVSGSLEVVTFDMQPTNPTKVSYESTFEKMNETGWFYRGDWNIRNGALSMTSDGEHAFAIAVDKDLQEKRTWDFANEEQLDDFAIYTSKTVKFAVNDGCLKPSDKLTTSSGTELKAILKGVTNMKSVTTDIIMPKDGSKVESALYLGASKAENNGNVITALGVLVERDTSGKIKMGFARWNQGWKGWAVGNEFVTTLGTANELQLAVEIFEGVVIARLMDKKAPDKCLVRVYNCASDKQDYITGATLAKGNIGFRIQNSMVSFDNLQVVTSNDGEKWDFESTEQVKDFSTYKYTGKGSKAEVVVADGTIKLSEVLNSSSDTQIKAILNDAMDVTGISFDMMPPAFGTKFESSVFMGASNAQDGKDKIKSLAVMIEGNERGQIKFGVAAYNDGWGGWKVGNKMNDFFAGNSDTLHVVINRYGDVIVGTLMQKSNPANYLQFAYNASEYSEMLKSGEMGFKFYNSDVKFDNLQAVYNTVDKTELNAAITETGTLIQEDYTADSWSTFQTALSKAKAVAADKNAARKEVQAAVTTLKAAADALEKNNVPVPITKVYDFEEVTQALDFDLYHSTSGGFGISNGKLISNAPLGEFKAILRGKNRSYSSVSVDIYPGEDGTVNAGIYLGASNAAHQADCIDAIVVGVDSKIDQGELQLDLFAGNFPKWSTLARKNIYRNSGLFTNAGYEPMNLRVDMEGNLITMTLSLISDPAVYVQATHTYKGSYDLAQGQVGLRSKNSKNTLDNFTVVYNSEGDMTSGNTQGNTSGNHTGAITSPKTGDDRNGLSWAIAGVTLSLGMIVWIAEKKRRREW